MNTSISDASLNYLSIMDEYYFGRINFETALRQLRGIVPLPDENIVNLLKETERDNIINFAPMRDGTQL